MVRCVCIIARLPAEKKGVPIDKRQTGMPPLNIGVIGCGHIGRVVHLKNLGRRSDVKIVAVAEADEACRAAVQVEYPGTTPFNDYRELLELARVDAVVI